MTTLPNLTKGVTKDPTPPATDTQLSPVTIPNGTTLLTTKVHNATVDNVDQIIDYISGDNSPNFIPQSAIENLVTDLAGKEDSLGFTPENIANKGAANGYAPLVSSLVPIVNLGTGTPDGTKFLRDDGTFVTPPGGGITSINTDTTPAQVIAAGTGLGILDAGATHTLSIDATVATLSGTQILTNKTITAVANTLTIASTDLTDTANIARDSNTLAFFSATTSLELLGIISDETGSGSLVFGTSPTIVTPTIASFANAGHNHQAAAGGGQLLSTSALSDTANIAYLNTANLYTAGARQDFLGLLAGTAGINIGGIAGNPTTQVDGDIWLNTSTNQIFGRINGANVDLGAGGGSGITSINTDTTAAQVLAGTLNRISLVDAGATHTFDIDVSYVGQSSITILGTITTGVWNGTAITGVNINAASTDLTDTAVIARSTNNLSFFSATTSAQLAGVISDETGTGVLVFGTSPTIVTPTIASFTNAGHNHQDAAGGGQLVATLALTATGTKDSTTFLRGDDTWAIPAGGGSGNVSYNDGVDAQLDRQIVIFDGTSGLIIQKGGQAGFEGPTIDSAGKMTIERGLSFTGNGIAIAAEEQIFAQSNILFLNASSAVRITINGTAEYSFDATGVNWNSNTLVNAGNVTLIEGAKLSVNSNATDAGFFDTGHTANPSSATEGDMYYNNSVNEYRFFDGTVWVSMGGGGGGSDTPWTEPHDFSGELLTWDIGATNDITTQQVGDILTTIVADNIANTGVQLAGNTFGDIRVINNNAGNVFRAELISNNNATDPSGEFRIRADILPAGDTGAIPIMAFEVRQNDNTVVVARDYFVWRNHVNEIMRLTRTGGGFSGNIGILDFPIVMELRGIDRIRNPNYAATDNTNDFIQMEASQRITWDETSGTEFSAITGLTGQMQFYVNSVLVSQFTDTNIVFNTAQAMSGLASISFDESGTSTITGIATDQGIKADLVSGDRFQIDINATEEYRFTNVAMTFGEGNNIIFGTTTGTIIGTAAAQKLSFFGTVPAIVQPVDGATLTNNVTVGGTDDVIADFVGSNYNTDALTIRDDIYQLARKVKILTDNLRALGLES